MTILSVTGPAHDDQLRVRSRAEPSIAIETMPMGSVFQKSFRDVYLSFTRCSARLEWLPSHGVTSYWQPKGVG